MHWLLPTWSRSMPKLKTSLWYVGRTAVTETCSGFTSMGISSGAVKRMFLGVVVVNPVIPRICAIPKSVIWATPWSETITLSWNIMRHRAMKYRVTPETYRFKVTVYDTLFVQISQTTDNFLGLQERSTDEQAWGHQASIVMKHLCPFKTWVIANVSQEIMTWNPFRH